MILKKPFFGKTLKKFSQNIKFTDNSHKNSYKCNPFVIDLVSELDESISYPKEYLPLPKPVKIYVYSGDIIEDYGKGWGWVKATHYRKIRPGDMSTYIILRNTHEMHIDVCPRMLTHQDVKSVCKSVFVGDLYKYDYDKRRYFRVISNCDYGWINNEIVIAMNQSELMLYNL